MPVVLVEIARKTLPACWGLVLLCACGVSEGPLLRALATQPGGTGAPPPVEDAAVAPTPDAGRPPPVGQVPSGPVQPGMALHYQVTGTPSVDAASDLVVVDLFEISAAQIASLHAAGHVVIAYLSAGSFEPWRPDADDFPDAVIGERLANYPNERWLDVRSPELRSIMQARLALARDKGFDGVFPSSLGAYLRDSGFPLAAADQSDYDRWLAAQSRTLGLSPGLSGDFALASQLDGAFDWVIAFSCLAADSCASLRPWIEKGKAVFDLETDGELSELCPRAQTLGLTVVLKHTSFDAWSRTCP